MFDGELLQEYENLLIEGDPQGEKIKKHIEQVLGKKLALIHGRDEFGSLLKDARRVQAKDAKKSIELKSYAERQNQLEIALTSIENDLKDLKAQRLLVERQVDNIDDELKNTEGVQRKNVSWKAYFQSARALSGSLQGLLTNNARSSRQLG